MKLKKIIGIIVYIIFLLSLIYATIEYIYYIKTNGTDCCSCGNGNSGHILDVCCECNFNVIEKLKYIFEK